MSSSTEPAHRNSAPADPAELRRDIEDVRGELADTVNALAYKLDVKGRAQEKTKEIKTQTAEKIHEVRAQAPEKVQQLAGSIQRKARQVKPGVALGVALTALVVLILRRRRRGR